MDSPHNVSPDLLAAYRISGPDHVDFLQGQLTQDVGRLGEALPLAMAASCDPKGRVLAVLTLIMQPDGVLVFLRRDIAPDWVRRLLMYRLRAKVDIDADDAAVALAVDASQLPAAPVAADLLPEHPGAARQTADRSLTVRRLGDTVEIYAARARDVEALRSAALSMSAWQAARVRAGLPDPGPDTLGKFTPHMLNLDRLDAISFAKGCYTGQEIVARTQHLGKVKRRMFRVDSVGAAPLREGEDVADSAGRRVGGVVTSAGRVALAVLSEADALAPGLVSGAGAALTVTPLLD